MPDARKVILKNMLSPGDVLCMSAAVHSLHRMNPNRFITSVESSIPHIWENNPDVYPLDRAKEEGFEIIEAHYPLIHQSNQRAVHVLQGYCDYLQQCLNVQVPLLTNRPLLFLSHQESQWMSQVEEITHNKNPFWVVNAGRKDDFTSKFWGSKNFQKVVDLLQGRVQFVQVGETWHHHPPLNGVINLIGKTDTRQLIRLVYHAQGCLTGISFLHHIAAAWQKPCISLLGGREPVQWNCYPLAQLCHVIGALPCCREGGCWKSRVVRLDDNSEQNLSLCEQPVAVNGETIPRCMSMISAEEIAKKIEMYLT